MKKKIDERLEHGDISPIFTVRGEHNVWHVYRNDERLEPPFRNQQRAELERSHHERSHALRRGGPIGEN